MIRFTQDHLGYKIGQERKFEAATEAAYVAARYAVTVQEPVSGPTFQSDYDFVGPWALRPLAEVPLGATAFITDGINGQFGGTPAYWNGTEWAAVAGPALSQTLLSGGIAIGLPPSGSVGVNGAFTPGSNLPGFYQNEGAYLYFPAGAVFAASPAGFYWVNQIDGSGSSGVINNNLYTGGQPRVPTTLTPVVSAARGAYVQTTAAITALLTTVPAKSMGPLGNVEVFVSRARSGAGTDSLRIVWGATNDYVGGGQASDAFWAVPKITISNRGRADRQVTLDSQNGDSGGGGAFNYRGYDTAALATPVGFEIQLGAATDCLILQAYKITVNPAS